MSTKTPVAAPRAFISYSWSSPTHESWVLSLATRLREDGVDAILDKWDLKPGHDAHAFMETMVTDPTVGKVVMVCDRIYAEKADGRSGGVGAESQIISPEIYRGKAQDKFVAVITEADEDGRAHVPVFYRGRIHIDFRSADRFEESYDQLLRWLVDRPMHVKPVLGAPPEHLLEARPAASRTQSRAKRAEDALRQGSPAAAALVREYGDALIAELRTHAPERIADEPFDEAVLRSTAAMRPYVRQFTELAATAARFCGDDHRPWERILAVQEGLGRLMHHAPDARSWREDQFDAHRIVAHESFLAVVAVALDEERFDLADAAARRPYLLREHDGSRLRATSSFPAFQEQVESLRQRNQRLGLNRTDLQADLVRESNPQGSSPGFEALMQADLVLFVRSGDQDLYHGWFPLTLLYATRRSSPFPVFARAESASFLSRLAPVLNASSADELRARVLRMNQSGVTSRMFGHWGLSIDRLVNAEHLAVLP